MFLKHPTHEAEGLSKNCIKTVTLTLKQDISKIHLKSQVVILIIMQFFFRIVTIFINLQKNINLHIDYNHL